jgi:hypothetical protein
MGVYRCQPVHRVRGEDALTNDPVVFRVRERDRTEITSSSRSISFGKKLEMIASLSISEPQVRCCSSVDSNEARERLIGVRNVWEGERQYYSNRFR